MRISEKVVQGNTQITNTAVVGTAKEQPSIKEASFRQAAGPLTRFHLSSMHGNH